MIGRNKHELKKSKTPCLPRLEIICCQIFVKLIWLLSFVFSRCWWTVCYPIVTASLAWFEEWASFLVCSLDLAVILVLLVLTTGFFSSSVVTLQTTGTGAGDQGELVSRMKTLEQENQSLQKGEVPPGSLCFYFLNLHSFLSIINMITRIHSCQN